MIYLLLLACIQIPEKTDNQYLAECYNALYAHAYGGSNFEYLVMLQRSKRKTLQHHCMSPSQAAQITKTKKSILSQ